MKNSEQIDSTETTGKKTGKNQEGVSWIVFISFLFCAKYFLRRKQKLFIKKRRNIRVRESVERTRNI